MKVTTSCNIFRGRTAFWLLLFAFAAIYLAFRLPWITSDPGIPSAWEYGYNATDEGYYLSGGKEKLLWGHFVSLPRTEAFTYGYSTGTHWLSYAAHLLFGLSTWTWRLPFLAIYLCAWLAMFCHLARRHGAVAAFALCTPISLIPMVVAYERTASNDALIGALLVLSYVCAAGRTRVRIALAGFIVSTIMLVKPSVWALLPVTAAGVVEARDLRACVKDLLLFVGVAVACTFAWKLPVALSLLPDAAAAGVSTGELVKRTLAHYPLPRLFDILNHLKGIASFPRDPSIMLLGVAAPLILSVPFAVAARNIVRKRWNGHLLLCLAIPAYVAAVSVMNTIYTHYFLPALAMLPILLAAAADELEDGADAQETVSWRRLMAPLLLILALCGIGTLLLAAQTTPPAVAQNFYSRVYNLPQKIVWAMTWPAMAVFVLVTLLAAAFLRGFRVSRLQMAAWPLVAAVAASVVFAAFPATQLAPYIKKASGMYLAPLAVSMAVSAVFLAAALGVKERLPWRATAACAIPLCILACYLATPNWRSAFCELLQKGTHVHQAAAKELAALLPKDAIVLGERSNQMLMSLPIRTAATFVANSDPIPVIEAILKAEPDAKLYALADSQHAYNLQHYREHADKYKLRLLRTFKMPSFGSGQPSDVYLCEIDVVARHAKQGVKPLANGSDSAPTQTQKAAKKDE